MSKTRTMAWVVWILASIFYAYQYILRVMPNIMMDDILAQFDLDAATFGQFSGVYYIGYSLLHLPIGIMLDRYGPKRVMPLCILLTVFGLLPIIFAEHWIYPILGRFLMGVGSSAAILGTFKIIRLTFRPEHFTRMLSLSVTIGLLGAIYGGGPVNYMCQTLGYQSVATTFSIMGVVLAGIAYVIIPPMQREERGSVLADIKNVMKNRKVIAICLLAGMMVGPLEGFADVWGTTFLRQVYGYEGTIAASMPSAIFIGMCFGAPILSLIAEKSGNYHGTIIASGLIMAVSFFLLLSGVVPMGAMSLMFILVGVCCAYQILAIYKASTYVDESVAGLTTAVANMVIMIFGYIFHSLIGWIVNLTGGAAESSAFIYGIGVIPIAVTLAVAGFVWIFLSERQWTAKPADLTDAAHTR